MKFLAVYFAVLVTYLVLDAIWLGFVSKDEYTKIMGNLLREDFIKWPWVIFYIIYSFAVTYLCVMPNLSSESFILTSVAGLIFGVAAYGTYNLTCYAIIDKWALSITIKDWAWGSFATTIIATSGYFTANKFFD